MKRRDMLLWGGILVPPLLWFCSEGAQFAVAPLACAGQGKTALHVIAWVCMAATAAIGAGSGAMWRRLHASTGPENAPAGRPADMALAALTLSLGFLLVQAAVWLPDILLAGCE